MPFSTAPTKFTITFNSNEGSAGNKATKPTDPTRANYSFAGWYKETELKTAFNFETETITANITLYAKWTAITYTVTFNSKEGSAVASITVTSGNKATKPTDPTRANYVFVGWYKETELTTAFNFDTETITANITLYAKWAIAVTSIAFDKTTLSETYIGKKIQITATVSPDNAANKDLTWTSSNETVASVTTNGLITTIAKGNATITATSNDGSNKTATFSLTVSNHFYIPDANFRNKLKGIAAANKTSWFSNIDDKENVLDITKANEFTGNLDVNTSSITNLSGIEYFTAITTLYCYSNQLTSLDVSKNVALTTLDCSINQMQSLDVSKNVALTTLWCYSNQLQSLDVSKNEALTSLYCNTNQLTSLDVSKNEALTSLYCNTNQLTSLDVSNNVQFGCEQECGSDEFVVPFQSIDEFGCEQECGSDEFVVLFQSIDEFGCEHECGSDDFVQECGSDDFVVPFQSIDEFGCAQECGSDDFVVPFQSIDEFGCTNNNSGLTSIKIHKSVGIITSAVNTELKEVKKLATSVQIDVYDGEGTNASHYTSSICDYDPDTGADELAPVASYIVDTMGKNANVFPNVPVPLTQVTAERDAFRDVVETLHATSLQEVKRLYRMDVVG
ncbi:hypothetical protein CHS0354_000579 [Potamilus streckersoni]|uniref:BIG2 domain-containing protein n=1 Tax=Potamilus streckersoni TaxID=2493646 RepID=A0AAE0T779_9BIVA|nr:hypothetical protein CHS0354_000579 [Potamilus streckersoni]